MRSPRRLRSAQRRRTSVSATIGGIVLDRRAGPSDPLSGDFAYGVCQPEKGAHTQVRLKKVVHRSSADRWKKTATASGLMAASLIVLVAARLVGQSSGPATGEFDIVSIKANTSGDGGTFVRFLPGGRFVGTNIMGRNLVQLAYQLGQLINVIGGPKWLDEERYDVEGRASGEPSVEQLQTMILPLLRDRFKLRAHRETRPLPVYALMLVRSDGTPGLRLKPFAGACATARLPSGGPAPAPDAAGARPCGIRYDTTATNGMRVTATGATFDQLLRWLPLHVDRIVIDRTGLTGRFDFEFEFMPVRRQPASPDLAAAAPPDGGTSIFTALQEQVGLRLESQRAPLDVVVIDSVEHPSES